jgi:hypothetical protein
MVNPKISLEQYKTLLERKEIARKYGERIQYKDLVDAWGVTQSTLGTILRRGIKQYDIIIWKEQQNERRRPVSTGIVAR